MSRFLHFAFALLLTLSLAGRAAAQEKRFAHAGIQADAKRYEAYLKSNWQPKGEARGLSAEGARILAAGNDPRAASRAYAQAVVFDGADAEAWTGLARALLAIKPDQGPERYDLPVNASGAALIAYERALTPATKAAALWVLHDALKRRSYWRPAIDALKVSLSLAENARVREAHDALVAEHGFRILEYKVDADSAQPRLCIQLSERLAAGQVEWAQYFKVDGKDPQSVTAEARQICLDGLSRRRDAGQDGRACRLRQGPRPLGAGDGARLRAAQPRPAGHPARHRQHRGGQRRGLPHRRPQPRADAAERRFRQADLCL
jgi:hypothetical protein